MKTKKQKNKSNLCEQHVSSRRPVWMEEGKAGKVTKLEKGKHSEEKQNKKHK